MFKVYFGSAAKKSFKKLDLQTQKVIKAWVVNNLQNCIDPRLKGKALTGNLNGLWRYRIGQYRLIAEIKDDKLIIILVDLGHRREIYK